MFRFLSSVFPRFRQLSLFGISVSRTSYFQHARTVRAWYRLILQYFGTLIPPEET